MTNYRAGIERIKRARTRQDLQRVEKSLANCYRYRLFTDSEYTSLDGKIVDKYIKLEVVQ
tara:strand:+ start:2229 stop:2408 length:180 start_codon:yes stop_codon:yes gene_type:complete